MKNTTKMVSEKNIKTGSPELYEKLPKGFLSLASKITGHPQTRIRRIALGDLYDDTGLVDVITEIAAESGEMKNNMKKLLQNYAKQNINSG